jgi:nicotinamidase-related amidase
MMRHKNLLDKDLTTLLIVDMQEPFLRTLFERERVISNVVRLVKGAELFGVPVIVTLQYAERMGDVIPEIAAVLPDSEHLDKMTFSCCGAESFVEQLESIGRRTILVCGIETHVCVNQTVHDLLALGYDVHIVEDAISSRREDDYLIGLRKMRKSGAISSSTEMALFELAYTAGTPEFKELLKLVK